MLGVGFDAQVVHHLPLPLKRVLGRGAYVVQSLREMVALPLPADPPCGSTARRPRPPASSSARAGFYAGRYLLAPDAMPAVAGFSVALFEHAGPAAALMYGAALPLDLLGRAPGVRQLRAQRVDLIGNRADPGAGRRRSGRLRAAVGGATRRRRSRW